jgi:PAS domain S-box-containing protein
MEPKQAQNSASDRERLRLLLDQVPGILWTVDRELRFTSSVGAALPALGLKPGQVVGMSLFEYFQTEDREAVPIAAHARALEGEVSSFEIKWEGRTFESHVEPFRDPDGQITGAIGVAFDVTLSKRAEEALKLSEGKYRTLFEESRDAIYVSATDGRFVDFNQAMLTLFGYTSEEMSTVNARDLYADAGDRRRFQETIEREGSVKDYEVKLLAKDGRVMHCLLSSTVQHDDVGNAVGYQGIIHDITLRVQAQSTLRREKEFSDIAIGSLPGLFYLFDESGRFLRGNRDIERVTGYSASELIEKTPLDFFGEEDADLIEQAIREVFEKGQSSVEADLVARDGSRIPYLFTAKLAVLDGKRCLVGTAIDLVERRRLEQQLRQSQKMEAVGQLAGGVAHDFNNVLTVILANSDFLLNQLGPQDPRRQELKDITEAAQRAASLTRQLLAFSRKQVLQPKVLNLNDVIYSLENMLQRLIGEDVEMFTMLEPDLWAVEADPGQIEQIVMNLAVNARDAMPAGGKVSIETGNVVIDETFAQTHYPIVPGHYVMLVLCDTGIGMQSEVRSRIFEPFFTTKPTGKGTGLGLSTVYGIVKQSGGYIWAYSDPGMGTTFKVYLPRIDKETKTAKPSIVPDISGSGAGTILLVEDERSVRTLARRILEARGYTVLEAEDGGSAEQLSLGHQGPIDLLLTDVVMPELSGPELAERLLPQRPETRVLYTSGYTDHAILRAAVWESGANFLQKPFTPESLVQKVQEILDAQGPSN